jgi:hypothetical protein
MDHHVIEIEQIELKKRHIHINVNNTNGNEYDEHESCDLSDVDVNNVNYMNINYIDENEECCICLNTLNSNERSLYTNESTSTERITLDCCKKHLHKQCLISWICYGNYTELNCPMCRVEISNITDIVSYMDIMNNINGNISNNTLFILERYYNNDEGYRRETRMAQRRENYLVLMDRTLILSILVWLIVLTSCLIMLVIINRN